MVIALLGKPWATAELASTQAAAHNTCFIDCRFIDNSSWMDLAPPGGGCGGVVQRKFRWIFVGDCP